jgi:site-specific recombinase XerD
MSGRILTFPGVTPPLTADLGTPVVVPSRRATTSSPTPTPLRPPRALTEAELEVQERMFRAYFEGRRPARNHSPVTIKGDQAAMHDLLTFIGQPLWELTESDFEIWTAHLGQIRRLAPTTQRRMQGAVACFMRYLARHTAFQNEVQAKFGKRLQAIATEENRIIHSTDANLTRKRRYLVMEEFQDLFRVLDAAIEIAVIERPRQARALMRDKAMFITFYTYGLRLSEGYGLNLSSFRPNPDLPELGSYGSADVYGKGSNGSGPRFRSVPAVLPDIRAVMDWYLQVVRPRYHPAPDENALWLSEWGRRLCRSSIAVRFKAILELTGHDPKLLSLHGLRHMSVSHEAEANVPLHFTQVRHGHRHASTTQQYTHLPEKFIRDIARRLVRQISDTGISDD